MKYALGFCLVVLQATTASAASKCDPIHDEMERRIEKFEKQSRRLLELPEDCTPALASVAADVVEASNAASSFVEKHDECALASVDVAVAHMKAASGYPKKLLETCPVKK